MPEKAHIHSVKLCLDAKMKVHLESEHEKQYHAQLKIYNRLNELIKGMVKQSHTNSMHN